MQPSALSHARSPVLYLFAVAVATSLLVLAPQVGSRALSLGAGAAAGGALATSLAGLAWRGGVPNPLVLGVVTFNVGDVAIAVGVALLTAAALLHAWRNRSRLFEPVDAARRPE